MSEGTGLFGGSIISRIFVILFAAMVVLLGANEVQRRHQQAHKNVEPSNVVAALSGEIDFAKPNIKERADQRAQLKQEKFEEAKAETRDTLKGWIDRLLR